MFRRRFFTFFCFLAFFCVFFVLEAASSALIVLDPGHGGKNLGARSRRHSFEEKRYTLPVAKMVKGYLEQKGHRVVLTREKDRFLSLKRRAKIANQCRADIFVSIHFNSAPKPWVHGIEVFYYAHRKKRNVVGKALARHVLNRTTKRTNAKSRGVKPARFVVLGETRMPAILVEGGFLTHQYERKRIKNSRYQDLLARGIAEGIDRFLKER